MYIDTIDLGKRPGGLGQLRQVGVISDKDYFDAFVASALAGVRRVKHRRMGARELDGHRIGCAAFRQRLGDFGGGTRLGVKVRLRRCVMKDDLQGEGRVGLGNSAEARERVATVAGKLFAGKKATERDDHAALVTNDVACASAA